LARPEVMMDTLTYLTARHGGAEAYFRAGGVEAADLAALRERLVETLPGRGIARPGGSTRPE